MVYPEIQKFLDYLFLIFLSDIQSDNPDIHIIIINHKNLSPDEEHHSREEVFIENTALIVLLQSLVQDILHAGHDVPGDVDLVRREAGISNDPVYPDVPHVLHRHSVQSRHPQQRVIQLMLLCCLDPEMKIYIVKLQ